MFTADAIHELSKTEQIKAASEALVDAINETGIAVLPSDFKQHNVEGWMPKRLRMRGSMSTPVVDDFATYVNATKEEGATVFVDMAGMSAVAVLNLGTPDNPGHCDSTAKYKPVATPAYIEYLRITQQSSVSQKAAAEFFTDWAHALAFEDDDGPIEAKHAIHAVRTITIEKANSLTSNEGSLSAERSAFDSVKATSKEHRIPARIIFKCVPYCHFKEYELAMRLAIRADGREPAIALSSVQLEVRQEEMAEEAAKKVRSALKDIPVLIGAFDSK